MLGQASSSSFRPGSSGPGLRPQVPQCRDNWRVLGAGSGRVEEINRRGLAAAVAVAADQGLPADDPRVLSARGNLIVHLAPAPVVARVATMTAWTRSEPFSWLAHEVAVADHVARQGGPVVAPTPLAEPGPHRGNGLAVSLWSYLPPSPLRPGPAAVGQALARLHLAAASFAGDLPFLSPVRAQITDGLAALERAEALDRPVLAALRRRHAQALAELEAATAGQAMVLHGDAHAGNLLHSPAGWLWTDLEEACRGPREFDLAVMAGRQGAHSAAALAAYCDVTGTAPPETGALAPFARARQLEGAVWSLGMAHQYPARYRDIAAKMLDSVMHAAESMP
jgi:Ser/Thr protein kinase RdoA (MazF antagonist)